jgi:hypothetical protein
MIIIKNLPKPSESLISRSKELMETAPLELHLKSVHDSIQNFTVNSISRQFVVDDEILNNLIDLEYQKYFKHKIVPSLAIIKNVEDRIACWPPHSDRTRICALHFYIEEGGENVQTVFYDKLDNYKSGPGTGKIFPYKNLIIDKVYHATMNEWQAFNVRQVHSIENIETTRLILNLSFLDINFFDLVENYPHFVGETVTPITGEFEELRRKLL